MRITCSQGSAGTVYRIYRKDAQFLAELQRIIPFLNECAGSVLIGGALWTRCRPHGRATRCRHGCGLPEASRQALVRECPGPARRWSGLGDELRSQRSRRLADVRPLAVGGRARGGHALGLRPAPSSARHRDLARAGLCLTIALTAAAGTSAPRTSYGTVQPTSTLMSQAASDMRRAVERRAGVDDRARLAGRAGVRHDVVALAAPAISKRSAPNAPWPRTHARCCTRAGTPGRPCCRCRGCRRGAPGRSARAGSAA